MFLHRLRHVTALGLLLPALVAGCSDAETNAVGQAQQAAESASDPMMAALSSLEAASRSPIALELDRGTVRFMRGEVSVAGADDASRSADFLARYGQAYGLGGRDFRLGLRRVRSTPVSHVTYFQTYKGVEVLGADLVVYLGGSSVRGTVGRLMSPNVLGLSVMPRIDEADAEKIARTALRLEHADRVASPRLVVVDPELLGLGKSAPRLAWYLGLGSQGGARALVDAHTGEFITHHATDQEAYQMEIEDANYTWEQTTWCYYEMFEGSNAATQNGVNAPYQNDPQVVGLWNISADTYDAYLDEFALDSFDDAGAFVQIFAHSTTKGTASWTSACNFFQITDKGVGYDIFLHEFTHALIDRTSNLIYKNESGALNESYADVMAAALDDPGPGWYTMGEDAPVGIIRDMSNPTPYGQPDTYSNYVELASIPDADMDGQPDDNGGVHTNSGIGNMAHYLMAAGGSKNGVSVSGIGREKMGHVAFITLQTLPENATYPDARNASVIVADLLADPPAPALPYLTSLEACNVQNAWAAVGVGEKDTDCDGIDDSDDTDVDGDFVPDWKDNCDDDKNPNQKDNDMDGAGDVCDPDDDNDDVPDTEDNCGKPNTDQKDVDNDGLGDACEDFDGDGDLDAKDNCPGDYNPQQEDSDGDGEGDACEPPDSDEDGTADPEDLCPFTADAEQKDSDGDGLGDACDECPFDKDASVAWSSGIDGVIPPHPVVPDADGDGTPDACDPTVYGLIVVESGGYVVDPGSLSSGGRHLVELSGALGAGALVPIDPCAIIDCSEGAIRYSVESEDGLTGVFIMDDAGRLLARSNGRSSELRFEPEAGRSYQMGFYRLADAGRTAQVWIAASGE